jgi:hypothetical protein
MKKKRGIAASFKVSPRGMHGLLKQQPQGIVTISKRINDAKIDMVDLDVLKQTIRAGKVL